MASDEYNYGSRFKHENDDGFQTNTEISHIESLEIDTEEVEIITKTGMNENFRGANSED